MFLIHNRNHDTHYNYYYIIVIIIYRISGGHVCGDERCGFLGCNAVYFGNNSTFRMKISPQSSGLKRKPSKKATRSRQQPNHLAACFPLVYFLVHFSTLKMDAICSSETAFFYFCWFLAWLSL
jgi:hypothetical protein